MSKIVREKTDKAGYDAFYKGKLSELAQAKSIAEYAVTYEQLRISPYYLGGHTKGYVRGRAVRQLLQRVSDLGLEPSNVIILDAGCGQGELSVYLACNGYKVIGVDVSFQGCASAAELAKKVGVSRSCSFLAASLEAIPLSDQSIDFIIGHASLHHFIKYRGVPKEFTRVMKVGAEGYFADSFGENKVYHLFHDKEKMKRLGDVPLSRFLIIDYFDGFEIDLTPMDWFTMLDKLYLRVFPRNFERLYRWLSRAHFWLDRKIPPTSRLALFMSGSVLTVIKKREANDKGRESSGHSLGEGK